MNFDIDRKVKRIEGQLIYIKEEYSFDFKPRKNSDISLMIGYLYLDFDSESMYAQRIWGYHPNKNWINENLSPPKAIEGGLRLKEIVEPGQSIRILEFEKLRTYYDKDCGWICIGDKKTANTGKSVEFADSVIIVLKNFKIKSIWLKPLFK